MRAFIFVVVFFSLLPMVLKRPYIGILMWYWISLMNPHRVIYGFATDIPYALLVAVVTLGSLLFLHPEEPKAPPRDRTTILLVALMIWISITSMVGRGVPDDILSVWAEPEKMLLMTIVAYTLTNTRERFDQLLLVCVPSIAIYGFKGGVFTILHGGAYRVYGPGGSKIADNNDIGCALAMIIPLLFYLSHRYTQPYLNGRCVL
jgi:putative inorganic carbon (hco3(-)) transporter